MKRIIVVLLLFFPASFSLHAAYFWDYPTLIAESTEASRYSDVKAVELAGDIIVFALTSGMDRARIVFFRTENWDRFYGPFTAVGGIELAEGFSPHYDVIVAGGTIYLVWNTVWGDIRVVESSNRGSSWSDERVVELEEAFSFDPTLSMIGDELFLFYHTESTGRRIDFFYVKSRDGGRSVAYPQRIAQGFAGSFFPKVSSSGDKLYVVWQSRPFFEKEASIFDIYLAVSSDDGNTWSDPVNLTEDVLGECVRPHFFFSGDGLILIWEGDRDGVWGIYERKYDMSGNPLEEPKKLNPSLFTAVSATPIIEEDGRLVFYIDERDGRYRVYCVKEELGRWFEEGPLSGPVKGYSLLRTDGNLYILTESEKGIGYVGPDQSVGAVVVQPSELGYIGKEGALVSWEEPKDSSGIEGYCYLFNTNEIDHPEVVNLGKSVRSLNLAPDHEGIYYLHLRARDRAGNISETVTVGFIADYTSPPPPTLRPLKVDAKGFYQGNSPLFSWEQEGNDIAGYNYTLSRKKVTITVPRIRTTGTRVRFDKVDGGEWWLSIAAVDRAGNVSETAWTRVTLRPPEVPPELEPEVVSPLWLLSRKTFRVHPFLNLSLMILLGGLLFITLLITFDVLVRYLTVRKETTMGKLGKRKPGELRFGLRFKFSVLIGALVLLLTIGISIILSVVSIEQEKRALARQMFDKAELSLENLTNVAREGILNNDELLLLSVVSKTMENSDIRHSIVLDLQNRVVAHSDIEQMGTVLEDRFTTKASGSDSVLIEPAFNEEELHELYELSSPVVFAGRRIGTVRVGYSTDSIFVTIDELRKKSIYNTILITIVTIVAGIAGAILLATVTINPIKVLAKGVDIIGSGNLNYKIHVKARDEIGMLALEFNRMTERLLEYQAQMEKKAKIDEQLEIARGIQQDLIPSTGIDTDRISIDGFYKAASGVGGDYYDFKEVDSGRYGLIMSDVAGKGIPASLMMIMIRSVFKSLIGSGVSDPGRVVTLMNSTLASDISSDRFATLLFGLFDMKKKTLRYTNAGYGPIMVYKRKEKLCSLVTSLEGSFPIGVLDDVEYSEEKPIKLSTGDVLVLFTDGIHEARNEQHKEYGIERLAGIVPSFADKGSKEMANLIIEDVLGFVGNAEQYDDMTLMVMKVK
jgi:serine phosphatase RsbU (regulator of sigma subunit)